MRMYKSTIALALAAGLSTSFLASRVWSQPSPRPSVSPSPSASPSRVPLVGAALREATEAMNFMHHVNNLEIQEGVNAEAMARGEEARSYAETLVKDHQKNEQQVLELAAEKEISIFGFQPATYETATSALLFELGGTVAFDQAFLSHEREAHEEVLERLRHYEKTVTDPEVKALIAQTIPVVQSHITLAGGGQPSPSPSASASPGPSPSPSPSASPNG